MACNCHSSPRRDWTSLRFSVGRYNLRRAERLIDVLQLPNEVLSCSGIRTSETSALRNRKSLSGACAERWMKHFVHRFQVFSDRRSHFGPLHIHGWAPHPMRGPPEHMIIYDHKDDLRVRRSWAGRSPVQWHTDQSPEIQPPGTTFICMLESPSTAGGDTLISSVRRSLQLPQFTAAPHT